jgi:hypothetical protein
MWRYQCALVYNALGFVASLQCYSSTSQSSVLQFDQLTAQDVRLSIHAQLSQCFTPMMSSSTLLLQPVLPLPPLHTISTIANTAVITLLLLVLHCRLALLDHR